MVIWGDDLICNRDEKHFQKLKLRKYPRIGFVNGPLTRLSKLLGLRRRFYIGGVVLVSRGMRFTALML